MKTCPYCAEEIQDAAIKCRYCQSWLVDEVPVSAETPPASVMKGPEEAPAVSPEPEPSEEPVAATEEPEPAAAEPPTVVSPAATPEPGPTGPATLPEPAPAVVTPPAVVPPTAEEKVEFTHSGGRYLLGYTEGFFGIWDRQAPAAPMERFPRTDDGWRQVWQRYAAIETNWMDLRTNQRSP